LTGPAPATLALASFISPPSAGCSRSTRSIYFTVAIFTAPVSTLLRVSISKGCRVAGIPTGTFKKRLTPGSGPIQLIGFGTERREAGIGKDTERDDGGEAAGSTE